MRIILPISGGLDSTYLLWGFLSETEDDITAVFLDLQKYQPVSPFYPNVSYAAGKQSDLDRVVRLVERLSSERSFTFQIKDPYPELDGQQNISLSCYLVEKITPLINAGDYDALAIPYEHGNEGHSSRMAGRSAHGFFAAMEIFRASAKRGKLWLPLMEQKYCQSQAFAELPQDILDLTLSCEKPTDDKPCGTCFKCSKREFFRKRLSLGETPQQAFAYWMAQATAVKGKWWPTRHWLKYHVPTYEGPVFPTTWDMPTWPSSVDMAS